VQSLVLQIKRHPPSVHEDGLGLAIAQVSVERRDDLDAFLASVHGLDLVFFIVVEIALQLHALVRVVLFELVNVLAGPGEVLVVLGRDVLCFLFQQMLASVLFVLFILLLADVVKGRLVNEH